MKNASLTTKVVLTTLRLLRADQCGATLPWRRGLMLSIAALCVLAGQSVMAQPANDNFENATIITTSTLTNTIVGSNVGATAQDGEPTTIDFSGSKSSTLGGKSVWWVLTPSTATPVTVSTDGSDFDTQLVVFTGDSLTNLVPVAANDDSGVGTNGASAVSFQTSSNTTYHILVDGVGGAQGNIQMTISGLTRVGGSTRPKVTITAPKNNVKVTDGTITVTGTASTTATNDGLAQIQVQAGTNAPVIANGLNNWTATVPLNPGQNTITVRAVSASGAESTTTTRTVTFSFPTPLTIQTNGQGSVTPNLNGKNVDVGTTVKLKATPANGWLFSNWTGATNSTNANLTFVMTTNAVLTANFTIMPFVPVQGSYNGLVQNDAPTTNNSGFFTFTANRNATFSGKLLLGGQNLPISGKFDTNGFATFTNKNITGNLQLDMTNFSDVVTGQVFGPDFTSSLIGDRATFDSRTNPSPYVGNYTVVFQHNDIVSGDGFATVTVNPAGQVTMSGKLADGTAISQSVPVSKDGFWPLFASAGGNGRNGTVFGFMLFSNQPSSSVSGVVTWSKPPTRNTFLSNGILTNLTAIGSLIITPTPGVPFLNWTNGLAVLSGDDFMVPLTNMVMFSSNNTVTTTFQMNSFKVTIDKSGAVRGSFMHPVTGHSDQIQGVVLPKTNWAGGFFLDTNGPGIFFMGEIPPTDTSVVVTPPASLNGATLSIAPNTRTRTGLFKSFTPGAFTFTDTNVTSDITSFGTASYNFSSAPSATANVSELNIFNGIVGNGRLAVVRMLLHFETGTSGTFVATATSGTASTTGTTGTTGKTNTGSGGNAGIETGTFTITGAPAPTP